MSVFAQFGGVECVGGPWDGERHSWQGLRVRVHLPGAREGVYEAGVQGPDTVYVWKGER